MTSKYIKPNWYPEVDVIAGKEGWLYTKNQNEVLSAIGYLDDKIIAELASQLTNTLAPVLSGPTITGSLLSTTNGTWSTDSSYSYRWESSTDNISWTTINNAVDSTYTLTETEETKYVRAVVIATAQTTVVEKESNSIGPITSV